MSELKLPTEIQNIIGRAKVNAEDVKFLREKFYPVGLSSDDDVMIIMALQNSCPETCEEWHDFFVESLSNFIVSHVPPSGELSEGNAAWVKRMLSIGGVLRTPLEVKCLMRALDISVSLPVSLSCLALDQLRLAMVERRGGYASMRSSSRPGITRGDLDFINRILVNRLFKNPNSLTDRELDIISAIDQGVAHTFNDPAWRTLMMSLHLNLENGETVRVAWEQTAGTSLWHQVVAA